MGLFIGAEEDLPAHLGDEARPRAIAAGADVFDHHGPSLGTVALPQLDAVHTVVRPQKDRSPRHGQSGPPGFGFHFVPATTGARILLDFRLNGAPMGSELAASSQRLLEVEVHATATIQSVDVVKNNEILGSFNEPVLDAAFSLPDGPSLETDFYYVRVIQADGHLAWSSPIWVGP